MNSFDFNTLFLDSVYKDTFERYCIRKRLITKTFDESHSSDISDLELIKTPLKGIKKLLVWLTLFEYVDSNSSIYDFTKLIDIGLIKESNFLSQSVDDSEVYCDEYVNAAKSLMKIYKRDVIKHIKNKDKQELHDLQVRSESRDFWKTIDASQRLFLCSDNLGNPLNLDKDYNKIIDSVDDLSGVATCFDNFQHKLDIGLILSRNISLDIGSIRDNLIEGLYHSDNNKMTYVSGLFAALFFGDAQTILLTELVRVSLHLQKFITGLVKLFTVLVVNRIHNKVIVNVSRVVMCCYQDLIAGKVFGKL